MEGLDWIALRLQTLSPTYDIIVSATSHDKEFTSTEYKTFIRFLEENYQIIDFDGLKKEIDCYSEIILKLDGKIGTWETYVEERNNKNYSFDEMVAYNGGYKNLLESEEESFEDKLQKSQKSIIQRGQEYFKNVIKGKNLFGDTVRKVDDD
jgi:hypothetical protein